MGIDYKTQTRRATRFKTNATNINLNCRSFVCGEFEVGLITSKYWGDFEPREEPLITFEIEGNNYELPLNEFIKKFKKVFKK